jgi:hypothetical protein
LDSRMVIYHIFHHISHNMNPRLTILRLNDQSRDLKGFQWKMFDEIRWQLWPPITMSLGWLIPEKVLRKPAFRMFPVNPFCGSKTMCKITLKSAQSNACS